MKCPKCHSDIAENTTICPHCHKVLSIVCPNCRTLGHSAVCKNCGYIVLEKCPKCGKYTPTTKDKCSCGLKMNFAVAYQECESDEFASINIKFNTLKEIRTRLKTKEVFKKFQTRLKNILTSQLKNLEGNVIIYGNNFVVNFNKELSFQTSSNKAVRLAVKIVNAFADLNQKTIKEMGVSLGLTLTVHKKNSDELLTYKKLEKDIKSLKSKKEELLYLKDMQVVLDQHVQDVVNNEFKTTTMYSLDVNGQNTMFYSILLNKYIIPPNEYISEEKLNLTGTESKKKNIFKENKNSLKVINIKTKCKFKNVSGNELINNLYTNKIISIKCDEDMEVPVSEIVKKYQEKTNVIHIICTEEENFKPWNLFTQIFKEYYKLSRDNSLIPKDFGAGHYQSILDLIFEKPVQSSTPEDARFTYMDIFCRFLYSFKNTTIVIEGCEYLDDTAVQTLDLYFDKYKRVNNNFVFITKEGYSLHHRIKSLMRTSLYTEITVFGSSIASLISDSTDDVSEFIKSKYYEQIVQYYSDSHLYFDNAIKYLKEQNILKSKDGKFIVDNSSQIVLPENLKELLQARLKLLNRNMDASMIVAYLAILGNRLDYATLKKLGIKNPEESVKLLQEADFVYVKDDFIYTNNYHSMKEAILSSLKREAIELLCKNSLRALKQGLSTANTALLLGKSGKYKEECKILWENTSFCMNTGDYDAYIKNCLGFASLLDITEKDLPAKKISQYKNEIYNNILTDLYGYSPEKIYPILKTLLTNAIENNDDIKVKKLSNLMLQGSLILSNYTDAQSLYNNILSNIENPELLINDAINTKVFLLSLVNIEILFNVGEYNNCITLGTELLNILNPKIIEKLTPPGFSTNSFVNHLLETFRLTAFAKLFRLDEDFDEFYKEIKQSVGVGLPEENCINTILDFIKGQSFIPSATEISSPFAKIILLILREFSEHRNSPKDFAQNIYQAKQLAMDINQKGLETFCDLMIAFAYSNIGFEQKAEIIYKNIEKESSKSSIYHERLIARYLLCRLKLNQNQSEELISEISNVLEELQNNNNQAKLFQLLFSKLLIDTEKIFKLNKVDIKKLEQNLSKISPDNSYAGIV